MDKEALKKEGISLLSLLLILGVCVGVAYAAVYYRAAGNGQSTKVDEYGKCRDIVNNNAQDIFIPTNTEAEYDSLLNNGAPNVTISQCLTMSCQISISEPANALGMSTHNGEGNRIHGTQAAADLACQQMGYNSAVTWTTQGWASCSNNWYSESNGAGGWYYLSGCDSIAGINSIKCAGTGSVCVGRCGNGVVDPGEQCDNNDSPNMNHCGNPEWTCNAQCKQVNNPENGGTCI